MADDHTFLRKVKGAEPEQFVFITMHANYSGIKGTTEPLSEDEVRDLLCSGGMRNEEIASCIGLARKQEI